MLYNTERACKSGLLVVEATVNEFAKPWTNLIDSGASSNQCSRRSVDWIQPYAEALKAQDSGDITVCLATGTCVSRRQILP